MLWAISAIGIQRAFAADHDGGHAAILLGKRYVCCTDPPTDVKASEQSIEFTMLEDKGRYSFLPPAAVDWNWPSSSTDAAFQEPSGVGLLWSGHALKSCNQSALTICPHIES